MGLGNHLIADHIEHGAAGKGQGKGKNRRGNGAVYAPAKDMSKSLTPLKAATQKVEFKKLNAKQFTAEQVEANLKAMAEKQQKKLQARK